MKKQFVTHEIALKLKELGFDEKCFGYYGNKYGEVELFSEFVLDHSKNIFYTQSRTETSAPLWQQVIDFFREMYCIFIEIKVGDYFDTLEESYPYYATCKVFKNEEIDGTALIRDEQDNYIFYSYYEARKQAILKAIELCQKKKLLKAID